MNGIGSWDTSYNDVDVKTKSPVPLQSLNRGEGSGGPGGVILTLQGFQGDNDENTVGIPATLTSSEEVDSYDGKELRALFGLCHRFTLKFKTCPSCPNFKITRGGNAEAEFMPDLAMNCKSAKRCCFCCCISLPCPWQTVSISSQVDGLERLNFMFKSYLWFPPCGTERLVDIYVPERNERIGWIKFDGNFKHGAHIVSTLTGEEFHTRKIDGANNGLCLQIMNSVGLPAAVASPTKGTIYKGSTTWHEFVLDMSDQIGTKDLGKAVLLVAFSIWVIEYKEKVIRRRTLFFFGSCLLGLIVFGIIYFFFLRQK